MAPTTRRLITHEHTKAGERASVHGDSVSAEPNTRLWVSGRSFWNSLPESVRAATDPRSFKQNMKT